MNGPALLAASAALLLTACADSSGIASQASALDPNRLTLVGTAAGAAAPWPASDWWTAYGDPQLDDLIREGLANSPTPRLAEARLRRAAALAGIAGAALRPQLDANATATLQRFTEHGPYPPQYAGRTRTMNRLGLDLAVPLDLWGGREAEFRAALGELRANEIEAQAARLDLATTIARTYAEFAAACDQLDISRELLRQKREIAGLSARLTQAGLLTEVESRQATAAIAAAEADIARGEEQVSLRRQRLAVLLGAGPDRGAAIRRPRLAGAADRGLPGTVPAELIGRRPDILAQRWRIEATSRQIAAAEARFYPNIDLAAFVGLQSIGLDQLVKAGSHIWGLGPAITLPIFDAGRLRGNLARANAERDIAIEQYNAAVLAAVQEVVGQLTSWRAARTALARERVAVAELERAWRLALLRYREGLSNYLTVLSAQGELIAQRRQEAEARSRQIDASMALAQALGGGFLPPAAPPPSSQGSAR